MHVFCARISATQRRTQMMRSLNFYKLVSLDDAVLSLEFLVQHLSKTSEAFKSFIFKSEIRGKNSWMITRSFQNATATLLIVLIASCVWILPTTSYSNSKPHRFTSTTSNNERLKLKRSYIAKHQKQEYETPTRILNEYDGDSNLRSRIQDINNVIKQNVLDYGALFIAPVLWGSYSPMIKGLYSTPGCDSLSILSTLD